MTYKRYQEDEDYRRAIINKAVIYNKEHKKERAERQKLKYQNDPVFRAKEIERNKLLYLKKKELKKKQQEEEKLKNN